jgi:hypothetical protein
MDSHDLQPQTKATSSEENKIIILVYSSTIQGKKVKVSLFYPLSILFELPFSKGNLIL